jgi:phosphate-selective porin OprO/OprP
MKSFIFFLLISVSIFSQTNQTTVFKPSVKMEGRIMFDFEFLKAGDYKLSGNEFRRMRLAAKGSVTEEISYKAEFDFAGGNVNFRDVYLKYKLPKKNGAIFIGSFTEPSSLNNMTSSKYITFFERSMLSNTQPFKYNTGFMYENQQLLEGKLGLQLAYTFNGYLKNKEAYKDTDLDGGANFIARVTTHLLDNKEKHQVLHLGLNYEYRDNNSGEYSYSLRQENHLGNKVKVAVSDFKNTSDIGFELASTFGSFSFQTEYELSSIITNSETYTNNAYYGFVSYFVTGEHRPYKNGSFGKIKPKKEFLKDKGLGALELVARYSVMDLTNYQGTNTGDKINNITLGFNWYLSKNTRVMYNFTSANFNDYTDIYVTTYNDENLKGHLVRFQVFF